MAEFKSSVNKFLEFNEYKILDKKGNISHDKAKKKAENEYDKFNKIRKIDSDFDKKIAKIIKKTK